MLKRGWIYLQERFPLAVQGPLILIFSVAGVSYSGLLRGEPHRLLLPVGMAFVSCLLLFLQLRIADEFKDLEEDRQFRPYRPVPRGLISLRELACVFVLGLGVEAGLAWWWHPHLLGLLLGVWIYLGVMSCEFGIPHWLKAHPGVYLLSHMGIMPLLHLYASSFDWLPQQGSPPPGLGWLLATSFVNGIVIEIGRKLRSPGDEENGVETYSRLWGVRRAVGLWWGMLLLTWILSAFTAAQIRFLWPVVISLGLIWLIALGSGQQFLTQQAPQQGKQLQSLSALWTLVLYFMLGLAPLIWRSL